MTTGVALSGLQIGLAMGTASMISVGPNNLMLIREGLVRGRTALMAAVVWSSYGVLVTLAVMVDALPLNVNDTLQTVLSWGGFAALAWFAVQSFRAAGQTSIATGPHHSREQSLSCAARALKVVWGNPLTYIELLLIPSALAHSMSGDGDRVAFAAALLATSAVCCFGYPYGGAVIVKVLRNHRAVRIFDLLSGAILTAIAAGLAVKLVAITA